MGGGSVLWLPILPRFGGCLEAAWGWLTTDLDKGSLQEKGELTLLIPPDTRTSSRGHAVKVA